MLDGRGNLPEIERPMLVDAVSCMFGGLRRDLHQRAPTSSRPPASARAPAPAWRRWSPAVLFAASLFFIPLVEPLQRLRFAYAPALIAVGLAR